MGERRIAHDRRRRTDLSRHRAPDPKPLEKLKTCTAWRNNANCLACDGRENSFFAGLAPDVIATLHVDVDNTATPSDEILYRPGTQAEHLWVLRTGAVKLVAASWDGAPRIVRVLKPGDVAGIEGLLAGGYAHTAVTVGRVHACRIPIRATRRICLEHAGFQWNLMRKWQAALRETEQWLVDMTSAGATARVRMARLLLRLRDGESSRIHNFSREDLGLMLGATIETASRIIAAFLRERLLVKREAGNQFYDADIARLEMVAQGH
ncbi:MAG: Crp/Fnr family transcriptional regulator [Candidatus Accumulibacter sp.]|nr:Crp/Fnr family transcriptional regulator [Accumulibacter sp.]